MGKHLANATTAMVAAFTINCHIYFAIKSLYVIVFLLAAGPSS